MLLHQILVYTKTTKKHY